MEGRTEFLLTATSRAEAELAAAAQWYSERYPMRAPRFEAAIRSAQQQLIEAPLRWAEFEPGYRRILVQGFPYSLIYSVEGEWVTVLGVMHQSRHPDAWRVTGPCGG
jgi:toxin ParE1/3/4